MDENGFLLEKEAMLSSFVSENQKQTLVKDVHLLHWDALNCWLPVNNYPFLCKNRCKEVAISFPSIAL